MASIEKRRSRGKIVYRVKVRQRGCPPESATFPSLAAARQWAIKTEAALQTQRRLPPSHYKKYTVSDAIDRYMTEVLPSKRASTAYNQVYHLRRWSATLGNLVLADVTPAIIAEQRDKLSRSRTGATVNRHLAAISHVFTVAIQEWGWIDANPVSKMRKLREARGRIRFLSTDERERLLAASRASRNRHLHLIVVLALSTGARRSEILGLQWNDINIDKGVIHLETTKNGERRTLPLTGYALDLMRQHPRNDSLFLFPSQSGDRPANIRDAWVGAVKRAGLVDFRLHDLRHTAASYLAMSGASLMEIAEILGHKSLAMTRRYSHLSQEHTRSVVERMNQAIFEGED